MINTMGAVVQSEVKWQKVGNICTSKYFKSVRLKTHEWSYAKYKISIEEILTR